MDLWETQNEINESHSMSNKSLLLITAEIHKVLKQMDLQLKASMELSMLQQEQIIQLRRRVERLEFPNRGVL